MSLLVSVAFGCNITVEPSNMETSGTEKVS